LFVLMAQFLTQSGIADELFLSMRYVFGRMRGGLGVSVIVVSTIFAACTGVIGASVTTMGVLALPLLLKYGYEKELSSGLVCAGGSLGIIIAPSIMLVVMASEAGVSVGKLFLSALGPGLLLAGLYTLYTIVYCYLKPSAGPALSKEEITISFSEKFILIVKNLVPPALLIVGVLGSIFLGIAGLISAMCFIILFGATCFTGVFLQAGCGGAIEEALLSSGIGKWGIFIIINIIVIILGMFIDWMGIVMIVLPTFMPIALSLGFDRLWFVTMVALNLQASFLTPPFGYALFYIKGILPAGITTEQVWRGVIPFILIIVLALILCTVFPQLILWLPNMS